MTTTPILGAAELVSAQALPETTENQRGRRFEQGAQHFNVISLALATPPGSPSDGDAYIVAASPTGAWAGQAKAIAYYQTGTGWIFITPRTGFTAYNQATDTDYRYVSSAWTALASLGATLDTDGTLAANSDIRVPSQKAVKTYVTASVVGLLDFKGSTDCSANPNYPAALKGDAYIVSVAGKIGGASGISVDAGDIYIASADNAGGTQAAVGASWFSLEHNGVFASGTGNLLATNNLSDLASAATARANLGLATYIAAAFFTTTPTSSEVLWLHVAGAAFTIPANFTAALQSSIGTNPAATFALDLQKNGTSIGTISVSTSGAVTATTVGGTSKSIAVGDVLKLVAPGTADTTAANMAFTIIGVR